MPYMVHAHLNPRTGVSFSVSFAVRSQQWACLESHYIQGPDIYIPDEQFDLSKKVSDQLRWRYRKGKPLSRVHALESVAPAVIALVLESPHLHEYTPDFHPLGPLMNARSQTRVVNYLPGMLDRMVEETRRGLHPLDVEDADIWLVNPIPYQASLVRLWQTQFRNKMLSSVRDNTWRALWGAEHDGQKVYQADFLERLATLAPLLVINACTAGLKEDVTDVLGQHTDYPVVTASKHPSYWGSTTALR